MTRPSIVISAVNLIEGGGLTVLRECLQAAQSQLSQTWDITAVVHRADLVGIPGIRYIERPEIKKSWFSRIWFEYIDSRAMSKKLQADFWLALHDMTPRVLAPRQAVYCHNAIAFYRISWRECRLDPKLLLFVLFYKYLYRINVRANTAVIVQQDWIRQEFISRYRCSNVIVAHPVAGQRPAACRANKRKGTKFLFASLPRVFKNFETLLRAWQLLSEDPQWHGELVVTLDGSENPYAHAITQEFGNLRNVRFSGRLTSEEMRRTYETSDCLIFPSRLETWGLPLTEAKQHGLAILAADLPYAHEAIGAYDGAAFFAPNDAVALAGKIRAFAHGQLAFAPTQTEPIPKPYAQDWKELFKLLLDNKPRIVDPH